MRILIFDDKPTITYFIQEYLDGKGHDLMFCNTCSKVREEMQTSEFDCYIVDLNAATVGLDDELQARTQGGLLTGWLLLTEYVWKEDAHGFTKTIIFSDYVAELKQYIASDKASDREKGWFTNLERCGHVISKSEKLAALVKAIDLINARGDS